MTLKQKNRIVFQANAIGKKDVIITEDLGLYLYFGQIEASTVTRPSHNGYCARNEVNNTVKEIKR